MNAPDIYIVRMHPADIARRARIYMLAEYSPARRRRESTIKGQIEFSRSVVKQLRALTHFTKRMSHSHKDEDEKHALKTVDFKDLWKAFPLESPIDLGKKLKGDVSQACCPRRYAPPDFCSGRAKSVPACGNAEAACASPVS